MLPRLRRLINLSYRGNHQGLRIGDRVSGLAESGLGPKSGETNGEFFRV